MFLAATLVSPGVAFAQSKVTSAPPPPEAKKLETAFLSAADRAASSVVQIDVGIREEVDGRMTRVGRLGDTPLARTTGSGVVLAADGTIVTSNHLIEDALSLSVRLPDGRVLPAKLLGRDPITDLAVLKVEATGLAPARLAETEPRAGQWVVSVGAPIAGSPSLAAGVVSSRGRGAQAQGVEDFLHVDVAISAANTGGPVVDLEGRVLGIASAAIGRGTGSGVAIPAPVAKKIAEQVAKTGRMDRAWIGASLQDLTGDIAAMLKVQPGSGVLIAGVADSGPAKKANLKPGDVIAAVAGKPVRDPSEALREILARPAGEALALEVVRDGKRYGTQVTLAARPEPALAPVPVQQQGVPQVGLGFNVRDLTAQESSQRGLVAKPLPVVTVVSPGSSADRAGLKIGDVIVEADGVAEPNTTQLQQASQDGQLLLRVRRRDGAFYAALKK